MLYASRNVEGKIISISDAPSSSSEAIDNNHPDVRKFFSTHNEDFSPDSFLDDSDVKIARILDDLVDLLVKKNIIMFTELPSEAQKKLLSRRVVRSLLHNDTTPSTSEQNTSFLSDEDSLL
ncbi:MAG: hypothetical protein HRU06_08295 [Oceanospirillaceae bacterium]|nr:hypothetical protein [Oceanospirillaceae bacterium]